MQTVLSLLFAGVLAASFWIPVPKTVTCHMEVWDAWGTILHGCDGDCNPSGSCYWEIDSDDDSTNPRASCECPSTQSPRGCRAFLVNPSGGGWKTGDYFYCETVDCANACNPRTTITSSLQSACLCPP